MTLGAAAIAAASFTTSAGASRTIRNGPAVPFLQPRRRPLPLPPHVPHALSPSSTPALTLSSSSPAASFHATAARAAPTPPHHFDTLQVVQRLQRDGFSAAQAEALMRVLRGAVAEGVAHTAQALVPRAEHARAAYQQKVDFAQLRAELLGADAAEHALTRAAHERLAGELAKLGARLRDEASVLQLRVRETDARIAQEAAGLRERVEGIKYSTLQWLMWVK